MGGATPSPPHASSILITGLPHSSCLMASSFSPIANKSVINSGQAAAYANMKHNTSIGSEPANLASGAEISPCLVELVNGQFMVAGSNGSVWLVEDFFGHK